MTAAQQAPAPPALGRGAVVRPQDPTPAWLQAATRITVDDAVLASPGPVVDRLHRLWMARTPYLVSLACAPEDLLVREVSAEPGFAHDPQFLFPIERLAYLVWANTYDCRGDQPTWWHTVKAVRAIAGLRAEGPADIVLADGRPAWVDGGPRQPLSLDKIVLHRDDTQRGVLAPSLPSTHDPEAVSDQAGPRHLRGLAPDQVAAVTAVEGAVRVAAPAGSGKTRVLTSRLAEVLGVRGTPADTVLALAYNTGAAAELRERAATRGVRAATVHAHALGVLRRHHGDVEVLGDREVRRILQPLVDPPRRANVDPLQAYIDALERVRNALVDPDQVDAERDDVSDLAMVFASYREALTRRGAVDFPEMVYGAIELLLTNPDVRAAEQDRVGQVLVDEFQDLTPAYLLFIRLLASPQLQCFGVGDDDQVIYGHAGATPRYLLHFDTLFPGSGDHPLTVNYRCPAPVVTAAVALLSHNTVRLDKTIRPGPNAATTDVNVIRVDTTHQARAAGADIEEQVTAGRALDDIAVLARVRVALLGVQADLSSRGIPTRSPIGEWLLERTGVRAALTYLRLSGSDTMSGQDLADVLHRPLRPVPGTVRDTLRRRTWTADSLIGLAHLSPPGGARRGLTDFARDLQVLRRRAQNQPTAEVLRFINDVIGLGDVAESLDASGSTSDTPAGSVMAASHIDDLQALIQVADHCPEPSRFAGFLAEVVRQPPTEGPAVRLSTIHSVKGLQWPSVVVIGAAEGVSPHRLATTTAMREEERRVFHVAITRARETLTVVAPKVGTSRFVAEMLGQPSLIATSDGPRPTVGRPTRPARSSPKRPGSAQAPPRFRATAGLTLSGAGGLSGTVESVVDDGALVRTARGSLLRVRFGDEVRVEGALGTLVRP